PGTGRDLPGRQGGRARLPRRPGDARDAGEGRPEGRQPAAAGEAERLGRLRMESLSVPRIAATTTGAASAAIATSGEACASRSPARSGPNGAVAARSVCEAAMVRPSRRSGMSMYEYAAIAESVFGNQNACSETHAAST